MAAVRGPRAAAIGAIVWLGVIAWQRPSPFDVEWGAALLLFAALVLVPLALDLAAPSDANDERAGLWRAIHLLRLPAALLLTAAFLLQPGLLAASLALPWMGTTSLVSLAALHRAWRRGALPLADLCVDAGLVYLVVGGGWTLLDRAGARPLQFSPIIVLLTAVHFHYAGLLLPLLTGLALRARRSTGVVGWAAGGAVIAGVPLVAMGITAAQRGAGGRVEAIAACVLAAGGLLCCGLHGQLAADRSRPPLARIFWLIAAMALAIGMPLAVAYGMREYWPSAALDIAWMRALHGTTNALGFGVAGVLGWTCARRTR